jgi:hypothetical protein
LVRKLKRVLFAGLAFARVMILNIRNPNGVSCPGFFQRPSSRPLDNLQARPTVYKSGTLAQCTGRVFFCQTPVSSAWPSHVIIVKAHWSCCQNATGIVDFLSILAMRIGSTCISGYIFDYTFITLCRQRPGWLLPTVVSRRESAGELARHGPVDSHGDGGWMQGTWRIMMDSRANLKGHGGCKGGSGPRWIPEPRVGAT